MDAMQTHDAKALVSTLAVDRVHDRDAAFTQACRITSTKGSPE